MEIIKTAKWRAVLVALIVFSTGFGVAALVEHSGYLIYDNFIANQWVNATNIHATTEIYRGATSLTDLLAAAGGGSLTKQASAFTYIAWKDGATYYANSTTGGTSYSGTNATVVFQNALTAMTTGGGLFIKAGSYILKGLQPNSNTTIWGEGPATKLIMPTGQYDDQGHIGHENLNIFYIESKTNVEIAYMELDGSQEAYAKYNIAPSHNYNGIRTYLSTHLKFHDLYIHDVRRSAILMRGEYHMYTPIYAEVYNCYFQNCNWDGAEFADCADFKHYDSWVTGTSDVCFAVWEGKRGTFSNIIGWDGNRNLGSTDGHNCMSFDGNPALTYPDSEILLVDCHFNDFDGEGVLLLNGCYASTIRGCTFTNIVGPALWSNNLKIRDFLVDGCTFRNIGTTGEMMAGITGTTGISQNIAITNCIFDNTGYNVGGMIGLFIGNVANPKVLYCTFKNINSKGIYLSNTKGALIEGNTFTNTTWYPMGFTNSNAVNIRDNNATKLIDYLFKFEGGNTNFLLEGNSFAWASAFNDGALPTGFVTRSNRGYITENSGTGSIAIHAKTATITHGLAVTPSAGNIHITWTSSLTNCTSWSITGITSSVFVVNLYDNTGVAKGPSSTVSFAWDYAKTP